MSVVVRKITEGFEIDPGAEHAFQPPFDGIEVALGQSDGRRNGDNEVRGVGWAVLQYIDDDWLAADQRSAVAAAPSAHLVARTAPQRPRGEVETEGRLRIEVERHLVAPNRIRGRDISLHFVVNVFSSALSPPSSPLDGA